MKFQPSKWPGGSQAACIKTFAERVIELTDKYSIDSYRHRTLSTSDKAVELKKWTRSVREKLIPKVTLDKMIEEYEASLVSDPIVEDICRVNRIPIESLKIKANFSLEKMDASLNLYISLVYPKYIATSVSMIAKTASNGLTGKRKMMRLAEYFIPHIISTGKSREFIHLSAKREFLLCPDEASETERLDGFMAEVLRGPRDYDILINCDRIFAEHICEFLGKKHIIWRDLPNFFKHSINSHKGVFVHLTYRGNDPFSVVRSVKFLTELIQSFSVIVPMNKNFRPVRMMYTFDGTTGEVYKVPPEEFVNFGTVVWDKAKRTQSMKELADFALGSRSDNVNSSTLQIVNALITASSASQLTNQNACLASIWSAFEGLLPVPMKDGQKSTRITHFADIIAPLATTSYVNELFRGMYSDLAKNFPSEFHSFIDNHGTGKNRFNKFLSVFYLNSTLQREFTEIFSECHILRIRAMTLCELANNPSKLRKVMQDHDKRVLWQIHRIYRERNNIMHSAASSKYSRSLIENSFSYFKEMVITLIRVSQRYGIRDVDTLIELCLALSNENREALLKYKDDQGREALSHAVLGPIQ